MNGPRRVPILVYHHVYPQGSPELDPAADGAGILGEAAFSRQMLYLVGRGWSVVSTSRIADWLAGEAELPARSVALHFDNGWLDTLEVAFPLLEELGMTATCFPITDGIEAASRGGTAAVRTLTEGVVEKPFMTWHDLRRLLAAGWEIGGHTATHCRMAEKLEAEGEAGVIEEVRTSHGLMERHLGRAPAHFAYPSGSRTEGTDRILAAYYRTLRLWHVEWPVRWTFTGRGTSPLALDCQNIDRRIGFRDFVRIFEEAGADPA